jgi:hypothetical protein
LDGSGICPSPGIMPPILPPNMPASDPRPPLLTFFIMSAIWRCCFISLLTSSTLVPEPLAMRMRRLALSRSGLARSALVIELITAICRSKIFSSWVTAMTAAFYPYFALGALVGDLRGGRNPIARYRGRLERGMSPLHDWRDWLGGYPFEVARPEQVFDFCRARGFTLQHLRTCGGGLGCNEFVFRRT